MASLQDDDEATKEEKLKAALWFAIGQKFDGLNLDATPHAIAALTEFISTQIETVAQDLEAFAKHRNRSTIGTKDVVLLAHRNGKLNRQLEEAAEDARENKKDKK